MAVSDSREARAVIEQLRTDLLLWLDDRDATAQFDALAERFYRDTGFMRPGKSMPLEMHGSQTDERRELEWRQWARAFRLSLITRLLADVLGSPRSEKDQEGEVARVGEHTVIPPERATAASDTAIRALWERVGIAADRADNFYQGPRVQPRMEADCMRHGMHQLRDELRTIVIEATGENPWNSESVR